MCEMFTLLTRLCAKFVKIKYFDFLSICVIHLIYKSVCVMIA